MYSWIFRHLPGPTWIRVIQSLLLIALVVLVLMNYVFPWLAPFSPWTDSTVGSAPASPLQTLDPAALSEGAPA